MQELPGFSQLEVHCKAPQPLAGEGLVVGEKLEERDDEKMTKVDIFSGFLGAGKTTLIKKLIEEAYNDEKIVLIENEFGEIGIDGGFLKDSGVEINEMNSGCICCSLVGDFAKALEQVIEQFNPDRILIEPSGVGKLSDVILAVENIKDERILLNGFTTIVDAKKCKMYMKNFGEFYNNQIEHASSIILSHTTDLRQEKLDACVAMVREHNETASLVTTPWGQITGEQILQTMEQKATLAVELEHLEEATHHHENHNHDHHDHECGCGHDHHGHHEHDHECSCGCGHDHDTHDNDHGHEGHHHADDVFTSLGVETTHKFSQEKIKDALTQLQNFAEYGQVLRAKGIVEGEDGQWIHFDYVPGEPDVRKGSAVATGMVCIIGVDIEEDNIKELFGL